MAGKSIEKIDVIGKWSEEKLDLLRKYLNAYANIMKGQSWCRNGYYYIDAFAGTGKPKSKDEERYIDGSPIVALKTKNPFRGYIFIEKEDWRVKKLEGLKNEFPDAHIEIKQGDCNKIIVNEIVPLVRFENFNRGIIFLDPFGMDVDWETIEAIAKTEALEIFLNFPVMAINRSVLMNDPNKIDKIKMERMNKLWGTEQWMGDIYKETPDFFERRVEKVSRSGKSLGALYKKRLEEVFPFVTVPLLMRNSVNAPLYCLIFAGHKANGKKIVEDIFKKFEKLSLS